MDVQGQLKRKYLSFKSGMKFKGLNKMKKSIISAALSLSLLTSGCASIVSDSSYPVAISSAPEGAIFEITNENGVKVHTGRTPTTVTLKSSSGYFSSASYNLTFKKDGFEDKTVVIEGSVDGWYVANILFGGLIGLLIIDPITGAMWKLPEVHAVSLDEAVATSESKGTDSLRIVSIDDVTDEMKAAMVRIN